MKRTVVTVVLMLLWLAAPAEAQKCVAPPGTAAVDQYCESVPTASGGSGGNGGASNGGPSSTGVDAGVVEQMAAVPGGEDAVRAVVGEQPKAGSKTSGKKDRGKDSAGTAKAPALPNAASAAPDNNPLTAVVSAAGNGSQIGNALIYTLLAITVIVMGAAWLRLRRRED